MPNFLLHLNDLAENYTILNESLISNSNLKWTLIKMTIYYTYRKLILVSIWIIIFMEFDANCVTKPKVSRHF